jgi:uridine phosphorylase
MSNANNVDKTEKTKGRPQYHIHVRPGEVGKYVLLPGDPDRVLRIAKYLDNAKEIAFHREHRTWTGEYRGIRVSATSTGMGCPSTAIAVEELANVGATHFLRVGSTAALQKGMHIGDLVVSTGSMRLDGTTQYYAHPAFPAVPDTFLTQALIDAAIQHGKESKCRLFIGLNASSDAFYAETPEFQKMITNHRVLNMEMESSAVFTISHLHGLKAAMVCAISGNLATGEVIYDRENTGLVQGWEDAIQVALEAIYRYETGGYEQRSTQFQPDFDFSERYYPKY